MGRSNVEELAESHLESSEVLRICLGGNGAALMPTATVDACLALLAASDMTIVEVTGAPPERHPRFRDLVILARALRRRVIHRCNLAAMAAPESADLPDLLAAHRVDVVVALPGRPSADAMSMHLLQALRRFTFAGYGLPGSGLRLDVVVPDDGDGEAAIASALAALGVRWRGLHLIPSRAPGDDVMAHLQRVVDAVSPADLLDVPCRSILQVGPTGDLSLSCDGQTVELGRNVRDPIAPQADGPDAVAVAFS
jgi:hypothetical protein